MRGRRPHQQSLRAGGVCGSRTRLADLKGRDPDRWTNTPRQRRGDRRESRPAACERTRKFSRARPARPRNLAGPIPAAAACQRWVTGGNRTRLNEGHDLAPNRRASATREGPRRMNRRRRLHTTAAAHAHPPSAPVRSHGVEPCPPGLRPGARPLSHDRAVRAGVEPAIFRLTAGRLAARPPYKRFRARESNPDRPVQSRSSCL